MSRIVLLDGGMGQELIHRSAQPPSPLWSANVMMDEPHLVQQIHQEYIEAGATVMTLNSYSATPERLARDASEGLFKPLQKKAIELAQRARGDNPVAIAGCLPPLVGSYHPELAPDFEVCLQTYRQIVTEQESSVDVFLCETMSSTKEARAATVAAVESGKPVWTSLSVEDGNGTHMRSAETVKLGVETAKDAGAAAILVNCSWPESIAQALPDLAKSGLPFGAYANGFRKANQLVPGGTVDSLEAREDLGPEAYGDHVMRWVDQGATIVGGCCEVGPAHIAEIANRLIKAGHSIESSTDV